MPRNRAHWLRFALAALAFGAIATGCVVSIPFEERPAAGYEHASSGPLRVALIDRTGGSDWVTAIALARRGYAEAAPRLAFQDGSEGAHIVIRVYRYDDAYPPAIPGYTFQPGVGGFAAVYDAAGIACNFPPSTLPVGCDGEIARGEIYLNDAIPDGPDIERRRLRLVLHELGHSLGLTRHSPDLAIDELSRRYGW